ncbi:MAG: hypothetical protein O3A47_08020 [Chloroflexi bacterium]|nr:hypothetical protein [Chloroflexota bacterium]
MWEYTAPDVGVKPQDSVLDETFKTWIRGAIGRVFQKLTPDELAATLERDRETASERALQTYFLSNQWQSLPEEARRALISADLEFRAAGGSRGIVPDRLRSAVREVLQERVWSRYVAWLKTKPSKNPR